MLPLHRVSSFRESFLWYGMALLGLTAIISCYWAPLFASIGSYINSVANQDSYFWVCRGEASVFGSVTLEGTGWLRYQAHRVHQTAATTAHVGEICSEAAATCAIATASSIDLHFLLVWVCRTWEILVFLLLVFFCRIKQNTVFLAHTMHPNKVRNLFLESRM